MRVHGGKCGHDRHRFDRQVTVCIYSLDRLSNLIASFRKLIELLFVVFISVPFCANLHSTEGFRANPVNSFFTRCRVRPADMLIAGNFNRQDNSGALYSTGTRPRSSYVERPGRDRKVYPGKRVSAVV